MNFLFFIICVTGAIPALTNFLELKPFPSPFSKFVVFSIAAGNLLTCCLCRWVAQRFAAAEMNATHDNKSGANQENKTAANVEEELLHEEEALNTNRLLKFCGLLLFYFLTDTLSEVCS